MVKLKLGDNYENSKTVLNLDLPSSSMSEILVGNSYGMSTREINLIERDAAILNRRISELHELTSTLLSKGSESRLAKAAAGKATEIADTASKIIKERKWYSVSAAGLLDAARAVGESASPLVLTALKIIDLLQKAKS